MLFNSYLFILGYLPVVFGTYLAVSRLDHRYGIAWLFVASLFFYGWWDPRYLLLLIPSIAFNYLVGRGLSRPDRTAGVRRALLAFGVAGDLLLLAFSNMPTSCWGPPMRWAACGCRCCMSSCHWAFRSSLSRRSPSWLTHMAARRASSASCGTACSFRIFRT